MKDAGRLSAEEALRLLKDHKNTAELMSIAKGAREKMHGNRAYYVHSLNINPTNVCENECELCAFWRKSDDKEAYSIDLDAAREKLIDAKGMGLTDLHIVGGLSKDMNLDYYVQLLGMCKEIMPDVLVQGLTAVEIEYLARNEDMSLTDVLTRLKDAGLGAIPGGGAEIFNTQIREQICPNKISGDTWLSVHENAHLLGIPTNATMLFGHIEKPEHIVEHLSKLRDLQDKTNGFQAFIALPFHTYGTHLDLERGPTGDQIARVVSLARIFLDNVPHIRLLANYLDRKLLQVMASCAVDDIGGTSLDERIAKAAGGSNDCCFYSCAEMEQFLMHLGLEPVLVNSIYEVKDGSKTTAPVESKTDMGSELKSLTQRIEQGARVAFDEAVRLHDDMSFAELGRLANIRRYAKIPENTVTLVCDRNISLTNVCESGCEFCAFYVDPGSPDAFTLSSDEVMQKVAEAVESGATQIMIQGGLNPELDLIFYEDLFKAIKDRFDVWNHSLTATEIVYLSQKTGISIKETLERLIAAGLDSLPGGGAEILVDEVRGRVSPRKISAAQWFEVMRTAHNLKLQSTATMVYGLGETTTQRVEHLIKLRELQDETGGFTAFIPWSFQPGRTRIDLEKCSGVDYLRIVALARIVLDNIPHLQGGWVTEGPDLDQLALSFGADDFGGILMEEQVVRSTGVSYAVDLNYAVHLIKSMGADAVQRGTSYDFIKKL